MALILKYRSSRPEIWRWYWRAWRRPRGLWRMHLLIFALVVGSMLLNRSRRRPLTPTDLGLSAAIGLLAVAWLPLWPMIRFKPQERVLNLNEQGASTTIGSKSGTVPWSKIASIEDSGDAISVTRTNGNAFVIPNRAFSSSDERAGCLKLIREWHQEARCR
jgi:hypothetical protein